MDGIAAVIGAVGGLLIGLSGTFFSYRRFSRKYKNASMKDNYQTVYSELRKDIGRLRDEQTEERKQWADERKALSGRIDMLQDLIRTQDKTIHSKEIEITQLNGKVELLQSQLDTYRDIHQPKNVTVNT